MVFKREICRLLNVRYPFVNNIYSHYLSYKYCAEGCIYMLHRVGIHDNSRLFSNENMKVSPHFLEKLITRYKNRGISFLSLDDVADLLEGRRKLSRKFVCFTFDDGYKDNYTNAYPIFKKHNVPFTVFVATDFPDYKAMLWWYELEDIILSNSTCQLGNGEVIPCDTYEEKCKAFLYIRSLILKLPNDNFLNDYCQLLNLQKSNVFDYVQKESMSWDDINEMANDPICTIGGHSISHPAFNILTNEELHGEVTDGCRRLEKKIGRKIEHFAYPFGTPNEIGEREHEYMRRSDFKTVSTTDFGFINSETNPKRLPRVFLSDMYNH